MTKINPQNSYMKKAKKFAIIQDLFGIVTLFLALTQSLTFVIPGKLFLIISGMVLLIDYLAAYFRDINFDKGHKLREDGLLDNSFSEKRIPNYDSESYYNNKSVKDGYIKLLANIHENTLFTSNISSKMFNYYSTVLGIVFAVFLTKLFMSGMDDYSSILLSFFVSSSFVNRAIKINSLKKTSEELFEKANLICNDYEIKKNEIHLLIPKILELVLKYENAVFESKITLSERVFNKLNDSLSIEWIKIRNNYSIYSDDHKK